MDSDKNDGMGTISSYYDMNAGGMVPSQKLQNQEQERKEKMDGIRRQKKKSMATFAKETVLICDLDIQDRLQISANLKKEGFVVFVAKNMDECRNILESIPVRAIIADINFPGVDMLTSVNGNTKVIFSGNGEIAEVAFPNAEKVHTPDEALAAVIGE